MAIFRSGNAAPPERRPDVSKDPAAKRAADQAEAALDNVREGHERAPLGSANKPSGPTGGDVSQAPRRPGGSR